VIIEDRHHIRDPAAVQLCPGAWQLIHHAPEQPDLWGVDRGLQAASHGKTQAALK
jgi:hypothetical protein